MNLYEKAKVHIQNCAWNKSFTFTFYTILNIIKRRMPLPQIIFKNDTTRILREKHIQKYMVPRRNGCFIDIGANIGQWTFLLAQKGITVHAFEPSPRQYRTLKEKAANYSNIHVYPYALGDSHYTAKLNIHYSSEHNSLAKKSYDFTGHQVQIIVKTLDSFNIQNVGLIFVDTEGYEIPVLLGAKETIQKHKPRLVIEVHQPYKPQLQKIEDILKDLNYKWIVSRGYNKHNIRVPIPYVIDDPLRG